MNVREIDMTIANAPCADLTSAAASYMADPYTPAQCRAISREVIDRLLTPADRHRMTAEAAYYRAERRGFSPGHELDDWLWAEHEVDLACGPLEPWPRWAMATSQ